MSEIDRKNFGLSHIQLKLIALISMLIDHSGKEFFPQDVAFRMLGRIAFPIFCFMIASGYFKTRSVPKYLLRLSIFAVISQIPFAIFADSGTFERMNVFVTLLLGLISIWIFDSIISSDMIHKFARYPLAFSIAILICYIGEYVNCDYKFFGTLFIFVFYLTIKFTDGHSDLRRKALIFIPVLYIFSNLWVQSFFGGQSVLSNYKFEFSIWQSLSVVFIFFYDDKKPGTHSILLKYGFYIFYPLHILIILLLNRILI